MRLPTVEFEDTSENREVLGLVVALVFASGLLIGIILGIVSARLAVDRP